jgi:hypothetical protein
MTGFVSNRGTGVAALAAPMSIVAFIFILQGYPWAGLAWVSLAFSAALWPVPALPAPKAVLRSKGNRP